MGCERRATELKSEHAALRLESHPCDVGAVPSAPSPADLVAAFKSLERGSVEMKPCKSLRFSKAYIDDTFRSGAQAGENINKLVVRSKDREQRRNVLESLLLKATRFHGRLHVLEGNRRLWALRKAEAKLGRSFSVRVDVQDMYLGCVHGKPTLRMFFDKYTTMNEGESVEVKQGASNLPQGVAASADASSASAPNNGPEPSRSSRDIFRGSRGKG